MKKGTSIYSLQPGKPPGFAVKNYVRIKAGHDGQKYHDLTQVQSTKLPPGQKMRTNVNKYITQEDICVAKGKARANTQHGSGGATQYYVSVKDAGKLMKISKERPI